MITRIFPNSVEPLSSPFNRQQIAALANLCDVEVIAPVPWFPGARLFGQGLRTARLTAVAPRGEVDGIPVSHPRTPYLPVIGAALALPLMRASLRKLVLSQRGRFDVVLGTWLYPDGCAAVRLADELGVPCVVKAHGTDVHVVAERADVRPFVRAILPRAASALAPSRELAGRLVRLGAPAKHTFHVPNGIDRALFFPQDRDRAREALRLPRDVRLIVYVGRLVKEKGIGELLRAHARLRGARLALVGDGPMRDEVFTAAATSDDRIMAPGALRAPEVARWIAAADVVALPSYSEGTPNAVLEAIACGRPVVATAVGGIPDVVHPERSGLLVPPRDELALSVALGHALSRAWAPSEVAALGPTTWLESAKTLFDILRAAVSRARARRHAA